MNRLADVETDDRKTGFFPILQSEELCIRAATQKGKWLLRKGWERRKRRGNGGMRCLEKSNGLKSDWQWVMTT